MAIETRITNAHYERYALEDSDRTWELWDGILREKPAMTAAHEWIDEKLAYMLMSQLDWSEYQVRSNKGRVIRPESTYFVPDAFVVPTNAVRAFLADDPALEAYRQPLPLAVEIWSRSTGDYDVEEKLAVYEHRGDSEIWLIHLNERTVVIWRRQPDGSYAESTPRTGVLAPVALPGVSIDLDLLFTA